METKRTKDRTEDFHINGFVVLNVGMFVLLFNVDGISGGGNVDVVENPTFVVELNCSKVGGLFVFANGFAARGAVEPNGFVAERKTLSKRMGEK